VFSNLLSITLPNIGKYFTGIHFSKGNYFPANKRGKRILYRIHGKDNTLCDILQYHRSELQQSSAVKLLGSNKILKIG
jgi:hypothetical protein